MGSRLCTILAAAMAFLTGCGTPSLHPLHSGDKEVFDDAIVGTWKDGDEGPTYTVTRAGDRYRLTVKNNDDKEPRTWDLDVRLVQLGKDRFADFSAIERVQSEHDERWGPLFIPTHMFAKYRVSDDRLTLWMVKREWLEKGVADKKVQLQTARVSQHELLIISETAELQAFVQKHTDDPAAFADKAELKKVK